MKFASTIACFVLSWFLAAALAEAGDWPMWRGDAGRGNASADDLPETLHLHWVRQLPAAQPAWPPSQPDLQFDRVPQPVVLGQRLFVPSTVNDNITAYDTRTGRELWRFYAGGPIRLAPVAADERVHFVADDGYLYTLEAATGKLLWKLNGGPGERWLIGNHRLISSWPARGGPVLHQGKLFFTASIWPFMGIFVHAVNPETGEILWTNSGDGANFTVQPHGAPSFGTVAPQGHLAASDNYLIVPGGRSTPAVFDTRTGKLLHFRFDGRIGNHQVLAENGLYYVDGYAYLASDGSRLAAVRPQIIDADMRICLDDEEAVELEAVGGDIKQVEKRDRRGKKIREKVLVRRSLGELVLEDGAGEVCLKAGHRLYTGGKGRLTAFDIRQPDRDKTRAAVWSADIDGSVDHMLAADDRLFVMTTDARLYCFGPQKTEPVRHALDIRALPRRNDAWTERVAELLKNKEAQTGYGVVLGSGSGRLIEELLRQSSLYVLVIEPDADRAESLRRQLQEAGLYGKRVSVHVGAPTALALPAYLASVVVTEDAELLLDNEKHLRHLFAALRPYGGLLALMLTAEQHKQWSALAEQLHDPQAQLRRQADWSLLERSGPLPNSANWTHQYGDASQCAVSADARVKAPLGLLWFGGPPHDGILPRHGHGPSPQVAGGRLIIEGPDLLRAVDVYTGRLLWQKTLKDLGRYYNTTRHFPGAGEIGSNYVTLPDSIYVVYGAAILELAPEDGRLKREFRLPVKPGQQPPSWGSAAVWGDYLVATSTPVDVPPLLLPQKIKDLKSLLPQQMPLPPGRYGAGSRQLVVFHRKTGKTLWTRTAEFHFRHNNICLGNGKVFCIDNVTESRQKSLARRGLKFEGEPRLYALDIRTGKEIWSTGENVFGTFLSYSAEHDILLQAGSQYRDRASDEVSRGMAAYRGSDGKVLWHDARLKYGGPCLLWHDKILTNGLGGFALELRTGKQTGWKYERKYGCNTAIGSEHLLTFRSGCAGFFDLEHDSGTGNLGGFRSSCTNNLIVADGVLNAPDYTRTCTCAYQNQTSLALVHMPEAEFWTYGGRATEGQLGFNLGAPGDRRAANGTLWQAQGKLDIEPEDAPVFRLHSALVSGVEPRWVTASGLAGVRRIKLSVTGDQARTVKLFFLEPDKLEPGRRVFDVSLQGKVVLPAFDIAASAGDAQRGLVREFTVEPHDGQIIIELRSRGQSPPLLSGVEVLAR